jgi:hypothetical protein
MIISPCSLGRRRVKVGVGGIGVKVIIGVGVLLLLRVLLLGAPRRAIIKRPSVVGGDVLLGGVVGRQVVLARRWATWKLDGAV